MNKVIMRRRGERILDEIDSPYSEMTQGLFVTDGPHAYSKLIAAACDAGMKFASITTFDDLAIREDNRVAGAIIKRAFVSAMPREITCVDPAAIESSLVIDATGYDARVIKTLETCGLIQTNKCIDAIHISKTLQHMFDQQQTQDSQLCQRRR